MSDDERAAPSDEEASFEGREPSDPLIECHILDGYTFRNFISVARQQSLNIAFVFREDGFSVEQRGGAAREAGAGKKVILGSFSKERLYLYRYAYREHKDDAELASSFEVPFKAQDIWRAIRSTGKKDSLCFSIYPDDSIIRFELMTNGEKNDSRSNTSYVPWIPHPSDGDSESEGAWAPRGDPNWQIRSSEFYKMCTAIDGMKSSSMVFTAYPAGIVCKGVISGSATHGAVYAFGTIPDDAGDKKVGRFLVKRPDPPSVAVDTATIKAMKKLNSLCPSGFIKVYIEKGVLRLTTQIGTYGDFYMSVAPSSQA